MKVNRLTIRAKITLLAFTGILFLVIVGVLGISTVSGLSKVSTSAVNKGSAALVLLDTLRHTESSFQGQVQEWKNILLRGNDPELYEKYLGAFKKRNAEVTKSLSNMRGQAEELGFPTEELDTLLVSYSKLHAGYLEALKSYNPAHATAGQETDKLVRGIDRDATEAMNKLAQDMVAFNDKLVKTSAQEMSAKDSQSMWLTGASLILGLPLLLWISIFVVRGIIRSLDAFQKTIAQINQGDFAARASTAGNDELATLATAFNELLDSRIATLAAIQKENEQLNESVLRLLRAVAQISTKDLTVSVHVSEDITGAVADALNLLTKETAKVMLDVNNISADVTKASMNVQAKADAMLVAAEQEREGVDRTAVSLTEAAQSMRSIADLAQASNAMADNAIKSTQLALNTVNSTVSGINSTRDVIRETEKRIKRLGERSQEISGVVNLINVIAERTHILALNASMHAASAGEAGRGFAVVADEVQRLAENARQATQQISALVNNIQLETADTVSTMNNAISQIVEGSRLAEQAGQQMQITQQNTAELVDSVKQIANTSEIQAKAGQALLDSAVQIKRSSQQATEQLQEQAAQTNNLLDYAKQLLASVRVFKLPA